MSISIRIPDHLAYGDGEPWPDRPAPMSIDDAVYRVVHDAPGGVAGLAARMGVPASTLTHKANPNNATHHMRPHELVDAQLFGGQHHVLHVMAQALGYTCTRDTPDQSGGDPVEAHMRMAMEWGELIRAFADATLAGDGRVTRNQMRRIEHHAQETIATIGHAMSALRARMHPAARKGQG